ncbi:MAG: hypothetical protein M0R17_02800 [Candidatus Omnitrophica bacterium]|jgi:hypothetical protein|nr:hypothetical protein [Candidatus Omnitrophota bacterium]
MICLKAEDYVEVYKKLSPLEKEIIDHLNPIDEKAFGLNLKIISGSDGNADSFDNFSSNIENLSEEEENALDDGASCIFSETILPKFKTKDHFEHGVDF